MAKQTEEIQEHEDIYVGGACLSRYWIYNEEHGCIAYGEIKSKIKLPIEGDADNR